MAGYADLAAELESPDLATLDDAAAAEKLNTDTVTVQVARSIIPAHEVFEAIVPGEWAALNAAEKQRVQTILAMGSVDLRGANTRASLGAAFGPATTTRANLLALQAETITRTRAEAAFGRTVTLPDVQHARSL